MSPECKSKKTNHYEIPTSLPIHIWFFEKCLKKSPTEEKAPIKL